MEANKKAFKSPRVLQSVQVEMEKDLLAGPSSLSRVLIVGQEVEPYPVTDESWYD